MSDKILRMKHLVEKTGLSKAQLCKMRRTAGFPMPVQLTERAIGWRESEIDLWLSKRQRVQFSAAPKRKATAEEKAPAAADAAA